jgi:FkbM family methyltransferase
MALIVPFGDYWLVCKRNVRLCVREPGDALWQLPYQHLFQVESGDVVIDAGAYIGLFTLSVARKARKVIAIEPDPRNFSILQTNVALARLKNVKLVNKALWCKRGKVKFYVSEQSSSSSIFGERQGQTQHVINVETTTLDDIVAEEHLSRIDFLKMDIEGAEIEALQGAVRTLKNTRKVVIAAYHVRNGKPTAPFVTSFLKKLGFNVIVIDEGEAIVYGYRE